MGRTRGEDGQTTMEWMAISAIVVGILAVLLASSPGVGAAVQSTFERLLCLVTGGGGCGEETAEEHICITAISRREANAEVTVLSIGGDLQVAAETFVTSDGTTSVRVSAQGSLGAEFIAGLSGEVGNLEAETPGVNVEVENRGNASVVFDFPDEATAEEFVGDLTTTVGATAVGGLVGPLGGLAGGALAAALTDLDPPSPTSVQFIGAVAAEASGSGTIVEGGGGGNVGVGVSHDLSNGHTTLIVEVGGQAGAEFQPLADAVGVEISSTTQVRLEVDAEGNPVGLVLRNTLTGEVSGFIAGTAAQSVIGDEPVVQEIATALIGVDPSATGQVRTTAEVDLTDPVLGDAAGALVDALAGGDPGAAADAAGTLAQEIYDNGQITADVYVGQEDALTVADLEGGKGIGFEVGLDGSVSHAELVASFIARPGEGIQQRCAD